MTMNEIESDVKALAELNKMLLNNSIDNFKVASEIARKVIIENEQINKSINKINKSIEIIGQIADNIGIAYENYNYGKVQEIVKGAL